MFNYSESESLLLPQTPSLWKPHEKQWTPRGGENGISSGFYRCEKKWTRSGGVQVLNGDGATPSWWNNFFEGIVEYIEIKEINK